jgi:hypothetical protein
VVESTGKVCAGSQSQPNLNLKTLMKSTPQISSNRRSPRSDSLASHEQRNFPLTDHSYQTSVEVETRRPSSTATATEIRGPRELHSFRNISNEFFGSEATIEYIVEAALFAWITCTAAWPIAVAIHQLVRWTI